MGIDNTIDYRIDYRIDFRIEFLVTLQNSNHNRIDLSLTETQTSIHNSFTIILNSSLTLVISDLVYFSFLLYEVTELKYGHICIILL